jgi:23S rRNA (uracil-5-)-methyltransferase RumA
MSEPKCKYFGRCGGCSAQHIDYSIQLENKKKLLLKAVLAKVNAEQLRINHTEPVDSREKALSGQYDDDAKENERHAISEKIKIFSGKEYNYRNRMDLIFTPSGIGLRKKDKWDRIIDIERCEIAVEKINELIKEIRDFFKSPDFFDIKSHHGTFMFAIIRATRLDSSISFVLNDKSQRLTEATEQISKFAENTDANNVVVSYIPPNAGRAVSEEYYTIKGTDNLRETYLGREFSFSLQGFFQNNSEMAEKMHEYVNEMLKSYGEENTKKTHLLDLYGGVGTFGINNAGLFKDVIIVENFAGSIESAKHNIEKNNIDNAKAIVLDAKNLKRLNLSNPLFVINDPPRSGMDPKTIEELNNLKPKVIIYISCNVIQLAKDLPKFKGYKVKSAALFDLFPQTPHSEAIVELICK